MRICFYAPFKPLGHSNPSGDLIIATGLYDFLLSRGHKVLIASTLRTRWIFLKPWRFVQIVIENIHTANRISAFAPDLWLTYHCYYKAPDLLGPTLCKKFNLPYCIFQGIYSTKQRRSLKGMLGFYLNRYGLLAADQIFSNRKMDMDNLLRIIPASRVNYIKPGIFPEQFTFDPDARKRMREKWQTGNLPVILSVAMFRPDVKTKGLIWLMQTLSKLVSDTIPFKLVIAGDGSERETLVKFAEELLPDRVVFTGRIKRDKMYQLYSGADLFAFPGIRESLGMVFLEAQSCGLPVVAFDNGGIPEIVQQGVTGLLTKPFDQKVFRTSVVQLLNNMTQRKTMGKAAAEHVRNNHDLHRNYLQFEKILLNHAHIS